MEGIKGLVLLITLAALVGAIIIIRRIVRRSRLTTKYGDTQVVEAIMAQKIWQGMSEDQLIESWGTPEDIDRKTFKAKRSQTYKYVTTGKNRFANRVFLENGIVVGWEQK
jgi:hypothetical protein